MRDAVKMARSKQYSMCVSNKFVQQGPYQAMLFILKSKISYFTNRVLLHGFRQPYFAVAKAK